MFPSLKTRPLHITGESYAGTYIVRMILCLELRQLFVKAISVHQPYITKTYFGLTDPPVNLSKIAIGDGSLGNDATVEILPTVSFGKPLVPRGYLLSHGT